MSTGLFFLRLSLVLPEETKASSQAVRSSLVKIDSTVADLDRTVLIAGGALNEARRIERDNSAGLQDVNRKTLDTLSHVDAFVLSLDASQKQAAASIQQTSQALAPVIEQTSRDIHDLEPAIQQLTPLLQQFTATASNLNNTTADVQHEVHKLVYPPPRKWWQKWFTDPLKAAGEMFKFTHPIG
jgi:methyl-accepting chemotaxis protein